MDQSSKIVPLNLHPMGFIEAFIHFGADADALLSGTGINRNMFNSRHAKISYFQQSQLIKNGIALCNRPGLGLLVGQFIDWSHNGTVGSVVYCSPSLKDAGDAFRRYLMIAQPYYAMYVDQPNFYIDKSGRIVNPFDHFANDNSDPAALAFEMEYRLAVTLRLWDLCGNKSVDDPGVHVRLKYPQPAHVDLYQELPWESLSFGCEQSSISASVPFVTEPWRPFRKAAFDRTVKQCEQEFKKTNIEPTYTEKVRWHINLNLLDKTLTLEKVARNLAVSPRSLTRKLAAENMNFRDIYHGVKMEWIVKHLRSSTLSVDEIADLIGFSSPSSLRRAIKNWSGVTVGKWRKPPQ